MRMFDLVACFFFFFFNDTATTEIYTLSLHDALPIWGQTSALPVQPGRLPLAEVRRPGTARFRCSMACTGSADRKSTRLNSSHSQISYAVFCLKKKKIHYRVECYLQPTHFIDHLSLMC